LHNFINHLYTVKKWTSYTEEKRRRCLSTLTIRGINCFGSHQKVRHSSLTYILPLHSSNSRVKFKRLRIWVINSTISVWDTSTMKPFSFLITKKNKTDTLIFSKFIPINWKKLIPTILSTSHTLLKCSQCAPLKMGVINILNHKYWKFQKKLDSMIQNSTWKYCVHV
jgi:hypothetical protein